MLRSHRHPVVPTGVQSLILFVLLTVCLSAHAGSSFIFDGDMHTGDVYAVAQLDQQRFATLGEDQKLVIRSLQDGAILQTFFLNHHLAGLQTFKMQVVGEQVYLLSRSIEGANESRLDVFNLSVGQFLPDRQFNKAAINDFAVSRDGKRLYMGLAKRKILKMIDLANNKENELLLAASPTSLCLPSGGDEVVVGQSNGAVMKYQLSSREKSSVALGSAIYDVDCRRSGAVVASQLNSEVITELDSETLKISRQTPIDRALGERYYLNVCQNVDGDIYVAGSAAQEQVVRLYRLPAANRSAVEVAKLGTNSSLSLACSNSRVIAGTADPAIFMFDTSLSRVHVQGPTSSDFRNIGPQLRYSKQKDTVTFSSRFGGRALKQFSFPELSVRPVSESSQASSRYLSCDEAVSLLQESSVAIAGRCLSASMTRNRLVLVNDWNILRFERVKGRFRQLGLLRTGSRNYGVAFADDDADLYITASSDGHLRWYRWRADQSHVTLFVHRNGRSWASWNSQAQFAASADMEQRLKFLAPGSSEYQGVDNIRSRYTRNISPAGLKKAQAKKVIAPTDKGFIDIVRPVSGATLNDRNVSVEIHIAEMENIDKAGISILADGQPVSITRGIGNMFTAELVEVKTVRDDLPKNSSAKINTSNSTTKSRPLSSAPQRAVAANSQFFNFSVSVPYGTKQLTATYFDQQRRYRSQQVKLYWSSRQREETEFESNRVVLLGFGMENYETQSLSLSYANDDVTGLQRAFEKTESDLLAQVYPNASREDFNRGFSWLLDEVKSDDLAVIFIAGHGVNYENQFYLLPVDADINDLQASSVSASFLQRKLLDLPSKTLVLLDACYSGQFSGQQLQLVDTDKAALELRDGGQSIAVFSSSTGRQVSVENTEWENGAFTEALVEALSGKADGFDRGKISLRDLEYYVSRRVSELTNYSQTPIMVLPPGVNDYNLVNL